MIKTAGEAVVKPMPEQVMQPMINRMTQVIPQSQGRPLPRLRRQRCRQPSECDIELSINVARTVAARCAISVVPPYQLMVENLGGVANRFTRDLMCV
jgi:hypothetical protein